MSKPTKAEQAIQYLLLLRKGSIPAARCSSAKARGAAKSYPYWGAAEYEIRAGHHGYPVTVCVSRASSDRRSTRLAKQDTEELAERIGGMVIRSIGRLSASELGEVWERLDRAAILRHRSRQVAPFRLASLAERLRDHKYRVLAAMGMRPEGNTRPIADTIVGMVWRDRPRPIADGQIQVGRWVYGQRWGDWHVARYVAHDDERDGQAFSSETNTERRRMIWEACGVRLLESGAVRMTVVHQDDFGTLYRCDTGAALRDDLVVKVANATPEPDGTYKDYFLRVPPDMRTARQAVAWTFGLTEQEYQPAMQS